MRYVCAGSILLFLAHASLSMAASSLGQVVGTLTMGTRSEAQDVSLGSVPITLLLFEMGSGESRELKTLTDDAGRFTFDDLKTGSGVGYKAWAMYRGVRYESEPFRILDAEGTTKQLGIQVYDVTPDPHAIEVLRHHFMMREEDNSLAITEYLVIHNRGEKTYLGRTTPQLPNPRTIQHSLPVGAIDIELGQNFDKILTHPANFGFYDSQAVPPGITEVSFSYRVPIVSTLEKTIYYPTHTFDLFFSNPDAQISSPQLGPAKVETLEDREFLYLKGENIAPATPLVIHLKGIAPFNYRGLFQRLTLLLSGGILAAGIGIAWYRRRQAIQNSDSHHADRDGERSLES